MQVRDIATNVHWEALYGLKIPVLATSELDNSREVRAACFTKG